MGPALRRIWWGLRVAEEEAPAIERLSGKGAVPGVARGAAQLTARGEGAIEREISARTMINFAKGFTPNSNAIRGAAPRVGVPKITAAVPQELPLASNASSAAGAAATNTGRFAHLQESLAGNTRAAGLVNKGGNTLMGAIIGAQTDPDTDREFWKSPYTWGGAALGFLLPATPQAFYNMGPVLSVTSDPNIERYLHEKGVAALLERMALATLAGSLGMRSPSFQSAAAAHMFAQPFANMANEFYSGLTGDPNAPLGSRLAPATAAALMGTISALARWPRTANLRGLGPLARGMERVLGWTGSLPSLAAISFLEPIAGRTLNVYGMNLAYKAQQAQAPSAVPSVDLPSWSSSPSAAPAAPATPAAPGDSGVPGGDPSAVPSADLPSWSSSSSTGSGAPGDLGASGDSGTFGTPDVLYFIGDLGASGDTGVTGDSGTSGASNASGSSGTTGTSGATGTTGTSGATGATGDSTASGASGALADLGLPPLSGVTAETLMNYLNNLSPEVRQMVVNELSGRQKMMALQRVQNLVRTSVNRRSDAARAVKLSYTNLAEATKLTYEIADYYAFNGASNVYDGFLKGKNINVQNPNDPLGIGGAALYGAQVVATALKATYGINLSEYSQLRLAEWYRQQAEDAFMKIVPPDKIAGIQTPEQWIQLFQNDPHARHLLGMAMLNAYHKARVNSIVTGEITRMAQPFMQTFGADAEPMIAYLLSGKLDLGLLVMSNQHQALGQLFKQATKDEEAMNAILPLLGAGIANPKLEPVVRDILKMTFPNAPVGQFVWSVKAFQRLGYSHADSVRKTLELARGMKTVDQNLNKFFGNLGLDTSSWGLLEKTLLIFGPALLLLGLLAGSPTVSAFGALALAATAWLRYNSAGQQQPNQQPNQQGTPTAFGLQPAYPNPEALPGMPPQALAARWSSPTNILAAEPQMQAILPWNMVPAYT